MALVPIKLPRINSVLPLVDLQGRPTIAVKNYLDALAKQAEDAVNAIINNVNTTAAAQAAAAAAQASATAAAADAAAAQSAVDGVSGTSGLNGSYVSPTQVLTATDAGADTTITVANHNRIYADGTTVAVTGGALTGLAYSTSYAVYYDQPSRAGGAVTYHATTDPATASPSTANPDRHYVGAVVTPAALGVPKLGIGAVSPNITFPGGFYP